MSQCNNDAKDLKSGNRCKNEIPKGLFSDSRSLSDGEVEIHFCSKKCREEFKKFHNLKTFE